VYGKRHGKVIFVFCPFGTRRWQLLIPFQPISRMLWADYQVVCYDFNTARVTRDPLKSIEILNSVFHDVATRVKEYKAQNISQFSCFGASMGTLFASYCAANIPEIKKVVLNLPYGDVAEHIATFPGILFLPKSRTQRFVQAIGGEEQLKKLTDRYSPLQNAPKLSKKQVLLYLALKDRVLLYKISVKLKESLENLGTNLTIVENKKLSHYFAATINHYKGGYMNFLNKP
jgi:hypothetical protein